MTKNQITPQPPKRRFFSKASSLPNLLQTAHQGESQLLRAQKDLITLRLNYKVGNFSGHPEEMLGDIDGAEMRIASLKNAKKRGWVPDEQLIIRLESELSEMQVKCSEGERKHWPEEDKAVLLRTIQKKLDKARMGLI